MLTRQEIKQRTNAMADMPQKTIDLLSALRRLTSLLEDPQPGLFTWHMACESVSKEVEQGIKESRESRG